APAPAPAPAPRTRAKAGAARRWPWAAAALLLLGALGLVAAERAGVTDLVAFAGRWLHPAGLRGVEVEDPGVQGTVDGWAPLVAGAGSREIPLRPGEYTVRASKDGKPVREERVSVVANARQVVRLVRTATPAAARPAAAAAPFDADEAR